MAKKKILPEEVAQSNVYVKDFFDILQPDQEPNASALMDCSHRGTSQLFSQKCRKNSTVTEEMCGR